MALFTYLKIILLRCFQFLAISGIQTDPKSPLNENYFCQLILLFTLFLLLFMGPTTLFNTIHGSHDTISANFYLQYFHQKVFNFNKINEFQMNPKRRKKNKRGQVVDIGWLNMELGIRK